MARHRNNVLHFRKPAWAGPSRPARKPRYRAKPRKGTWARAFVDLRPWLLAIMLATLVALNVMTGRLDLSRWLGSNEAEIAALGSFGGEVVDSRFGRCSNGGSRACVVDGDTFRLGERRVRVVGIDTAETSARCPAEAAQAEASTRALQQWLNRGAFVMVIEGHDARDRYDRELRTLVRHGADGRVDRLADFMRTEGGARSYNGGYRNGWC